LTVGAVSLTSSSHLVITEAGRDYLAVVRDALDRIAVRTERLLQRQSAGVLTVCTSPDFAAKWLVHRLGNFAEAHSDIDLRVSATLHHVDFARGGLIGFDTRRPEEDTMLQPFGEQTKPGAIPIDDLDQVGPGAAAEHEQVSRERILLQYALHQHGEAVDALAHIDEA
jgi:DNA-binding transcriptional LysR family regulator